MDPGPYGPVVGLQEIKIDVVPVPTVNVSELDVIPEETTVIEAVCGTVRLPAGIVAVNSVVLRYAVERGAPLKYTSEAVVKPLPITVTFVAPEPAGVDEGDNVLIDKPLLTEPTPVSPANTS
jgi:hypothetical protein